MKRYSIIVMQRDAERETEFCQVDSNPKEIAQALASKTTTGRKHLLLYTSVRIRDNEETQATA